MFTAADFNFKVDTIANQGLIPIGFKKSGLHYFKHEPPHYYGIIKHTFRGFFEDYYVVYSHEAAGTNYDAIIKKPKSLLRHYPVSVNLMELPIIYKVAQHAIDSPYTFFNMARSYNVDMNCLESEETWRDSFRTKSERDEKLKTDAHYLDSYVTELFDIINQYGFRFFEDCSLDLCYHSIQDAIENKKNEQYLPWYLGFKNDFETYFKTKGMDPPNTLIRPTQKNFLQRISSLFVKK